MTGSEGGQPRAAGSLLGRVLRWMGAALAVAYPFLLFVGLVVFEPRVVAACLVLLLAVRAVLRGAPLRLEAARGLLLPLALVGGVLLATLLSNDERALLLLPVAINLALLFAFARTLRGARPSMIETFARLQDPELSPAQRGHCRTFTWVWCVFFALNAALTAGLAAWASTWIWTLYTGLVAYLLMGGLFAAEFLVRAWRFRRYEGSVLEPILRRIFPPRPSAPRSRT